MNGIFGQSMQSFKAAWVTNSGSVGRGIKLTNLAAEQIAIFPADAYCSADELTSLALPSFKTNKRLVIKQGLHAFSGQGNTFLSRQDSKPRTTFEFEAKDILGFSGVKASYTPQTEIVALGYDGLDASKTLGGRLDAKPLYVNIRLSGEPIKRFFHTNFIDHRIAIDKELCVGDCECYDECGKIKCDIIADGIVKAINKDSLFAMGKNGTMYNAPLRQFLKANKIKKCTTPAVAPVLTEFKKYEIVIPDDGFTTIGRLGMKYPNAKVSLESRADGSSIYAMWLPVADPAPAAFTLTTHVQAICDTCPTCPTTYTTVDGLKVVSVRVACGAAAPTITGSISRLLVSSTLSGGDLYIIKVPKTQTDEAIEAQFVGCLEGSVIGEEGKSCVGSNVTFNWVSCDNCFKTQKDYMITLPDADCKKGLSRLIELQEAYPELIVTDFAAGTCSHVYKTTVASNCVGTEDCGRLVDYSFSAPATYEGFRWVDAKPVLTDPDCTVEDLVPDDCCVCGVILETSAWNPTYSDCTYGWTNYHPTDAKPVRVQVNIHSLDYSDNPCDETKTYSTVLQRVKAGLGTTGALVQQYERSLLIYENKTWVSNPFANDISGFIPVAKAHLLYDQYVLRLKRRQFGDSHLYKDQGTMDYVFYVPTGEGKDLENLLNELIYSTGNPELKPVFL